ncbi:MAG: HAD family hydrolase [Candidatus Promineifilaceae bacterium]|nr:HAD family hydrolase [Anaerolineaceae bacterium]
MSSSRNTWQTGPVTAVLFDWDFTLAYSLGPNVSHIARTTRLFQEYGVVCTEAEVAAAQASLEADIASGKMSGSLRPQKKREIIRLYGELLRRLNHPDTSYEFAYSVYAGYGLLPHYLFDDVLPTLRTLQNQNLKLGILSNHSSSVRGTIEQLMGDIVPQTHVIISEEVGVHKPSKTIFRRAASKLHQAPGSCLYVGDNLVVDAEAAVNAGHFAAGIWIDRADSGAALPLPENVFRITSLLQLLLFFGR